jgi:hypothetical protein
MSCDHSKDTLAILGKKQNIKINNIIFPQFERKIQNLPVGKYSPRKKKQLHQFLARGGS